MSERITITRDQNHPDKVVLLKDGVYVCDMDWSVARAFARGVMSVSKLAEEYANANKLISQEALLIRTGAPFALSTKANPKIREAAYSEAQWGNSRKQMPLSVPSARECGTPTVTKHPKVIQ